jgi:enhancing lycopene biosynthesis protein 2
MSEKRVAVILSGCGVMDGSEIHESVLTLLYLDRGGAKVTLFAPDKDQAKVHNHFTARDEAFKRNTLAESARIARGKIKDIKQARAEDFDAVVLPGGYGAALNLCTFGQDGSKCTVDQDVSVFLRNMHEKGKVIGAICIAPALVAKVFGGDLHPDLTIGSDAGTAAELERMGAKHVRCAVNDVVVDKKNRIVTTPAYMLAERIGQAAEGIEKLVGKVLEMA